MFPKRAKKETNIDNCTTIYLSYSSGSPRVVIFPVQKFLIGLPTGLSDKYNEYIFAERYKPKKYWLVKKRGIAMNIRASLIDIQIINKTKVERPIILNFGTNDGFTIKLEKSRKNVINRSITKKLW